MKFRANFIVICLIACVIFISSCASLGPVYQKADPPAGKAIIYFYRPFSFLGAPIKYSIWDVTNPIVTKKVTIVYDIGKEYPRIDKYKEGIESAGNLATFYYFMAGGTVASKEHFFGQWGVTDFIIKVEAKAGKRYYFYSQISGGGRPHIETRTIEQGEKEIADCRHVIDEKQ